MRLIFGSDSLCYIIKGFISLKTIRVIVKHNLIMLSVRMGFGLAEGHSKVTNTCTDYATEADELR